MTILRHECRLGRTMLWIWSATLAFLIVLCIFLFPEMKTEVSDMGDLFSSMGSFTEAFGMDRLNFGELTGFYGVECGNILGLGGAFFAALLGISMLAKEEKGHTAEFLLTHPVSRGRVAAEKLWALWVQITALNIVVLLAAGLSIAAIGEKLEWDRILLLHLAYYFLQLEIGAVCFGISAWVGGPGIGLGIAVLLYFCNLIANISKEVEFLKYITPFGYAEGADIMESGNIEPVLLLLGCLYGSIGAVVGIMRYRRKDISG